jgi:hypothetical protein
MKITIEIELPEGQERPTDEMILRLTDPDWLASWWNIDDVREVNGGEDLTDGEAQDVLELAENRFDANIGINWEVLEHYVDCVLGDRKE